MAREIRVPTLPGVTVYVVLYDPSDAAYKGAGVWEAPVSGDWAAYAAAIPLTPQVGNLLVGDMPAAALAAGAYLAIPYLQVAAAPSPTNDLPQTAVEIDWNGAAVVVGAAGTPTRYAGVSDVQARVPTQLCAFSSLSQPSQANVLTWLNMESRFVEACLSWRYLVPVTDATDLAVIGEIVADLVASRVWGVLSGQSATESTAARDLRAQALLTLAYNVKDGRAYLILPNTTEQTSGPAAAYVPAGSFTDPNQCGDDANGNPIQPYSFTTRMDL